ncbi:MAG TPA: hypothetical protein VFW83_00655, partial [Bryobacteraceae bacterium]|nr:hypothetical protein [Bryobacteraceae bacterium]
TRGDQLVVEAFPFEATLNAEPLAPASPPAGSSPGTSIWPPALARWFALKNFTLLAGAGAGAILVLIAGFIWALLQGKKKRGGGVQTSDSIEGNAARQIGPTPEEIEREIEARMAEQAAEHAKREAETLMRLKLPAISTKKTEVLTKHIAAETKKDPSAMAQVVRNWLHGDSQQQR